MDRLVAAKDRGLIAPGYRADINIIDYDNLEAARGQPSSNDLPTGGRRLMQRASGYVATAGCGQHHLPKRRIDISAKCAFYSFR